MDRVEHIVAIKEIAHHEQNRLLPVYFKKRLLQICQLGNKLNVIIK